MGKGTMTSGMDAQQPDKSGLKTPEDSKDEVETLAVKTSIGEIKKIKSNNKKVCLDCGIPITKENNSGWEKFTGDGSVTQPVCKTCNEKGEGGESPPVEEKKE